MMMGLITKNTIDKIEVGKRLYQLRERIGYSRETISNITQISVSTLKSWELGRAEVRLHNLQAYLTSLKSLGCHTKINWVLYGDASVQPEIKKTSSLMSFSININNVLNLLNLTSNLFYCLDASGNVVHIKKEWQHFLGVKQSSSIANKNNNLLTDVQKLVNAKEDTKISLHTICSNQIYTVCHEYYLKCMTSNIKHVYFSYYLTDEFNKNLTEIKMLYIPIIGDKSRKVIGVFGFLSEARAKTD